MEVFERGTRVFRVAMDGGWDETDLEVDVNAFGRESETQKTRKFVGGDSRGGFVAVPERDVVQGKMHRLDADVGQCTYCRTRGSRRSVRGEYIDIGNVAYIDM